MNRDIGIGSGKGIMDLWHKKSRGMTSRSNAGVGTNLVILRMPMLTAPVAVVSSAVRGMIWPLAMAYTVRRRRRKVGPTWATMRRLLMFMNEGIHIPVAWNVANKEVDQLSLLYVVETKGVIGSGRTITYVFHPVGEGRDWPCAIRDSGMANPVERMHNSVVPRPKIGNMGG